MTENENWLDGICQYDGPGSDLPAGGYSKVFGWFPEKTARYWIVIDAESDEGTKQKKTAELTRDDIIIGVYLNALVAMRNMRQKLMRRK